MKIIIITPYPENQAPSQRFRFEHFLEDFKKEKIDYKYVPFIDQNTWEILYKKGNSIKKIFGILKGFINRFFLLFTLSKYDFIFIHREASPLGPPIFEFIIAKIIKRKIVYDFDDAIWLPNTSQQNKIAASLKWHHKVDIICKWSHKVSCGNEYLADYARKFNKNVFVIPTVVDIKKRHNPHLIPISKKTKNKPTIGWTGSHSTLIYLNDLIPILQELEKEINFNFLVIANRDPEIQLKNYQFIKWNEATEIEDLSKIDIGVMPLPDNKWTRGKCGFKAIQYMALGIPAVISPVSVNTKIVNNRINGFWCSNPDEWKVSIKKLLNDNILKEKMGISAREKIEKHYSTQAIKKDFLKLFS